MHPEVVTPIWRPCGLPPHHLAWLLATSSASSSHFTYQFGSASKLPGSRHMTPVIMKGHPACLGEVGLAPWPPDAGHSPLMKLACLLCRSAPCQLSHSSKDMCSTMTYQLPLPATHNALIGTKYINTLPLNLFSRPSRQFFAMQESLKLPSISSLEALLKSSPFNKGFPWQTFLSIHGPLKGFTIFLNPPKSFNSLLRCRVGLPCLA